MNRAERRALQFNPFSDSRRYYQYPLSYHDHNGIQQDIEAAFDELYESGYNFNHRFILADGQSTIAEM